MTTLDPRVVAEITRQDAVSTYGTDRDGVRLALACMQDELDETLLAFQAEKRPIEGRTWQQVQFELVQTVAIGLRLLRDLSPADSAPVPVTVPYGTARALCLADPDVDPTGRSIAGPVCADCAPRPTTVR